MGVFRLILGLVLLLLGVASCGPGFCSLTGCVTPTESITTFVLGQLTTSSWRQRDAGFSSVTSVSGVGTRLFAADANANRVLGWNTLPTSNNQAADFVLGQSSLYSVTANGGGSASALTLSDPKSVFTDGTRLFVADGDNNRVLIWNSLPSSTQVPADVVVGQADFSGSTSNNGGIGPETLSGPQGVYSDGTSLFVADTSNHRVLIWSTIPTSSGASADFVLGQDDFTSNAANQGGTAEADTLSQPIGIFSDGTRFFVADSNNNRVLGWNATPGASTVPANYVLGQANLTSQAFVDPPNSQTLRSPGYVFSDGTRLFVNDTGAHRTLIWNTIPTATQTAADIVLGQTAMSGDTGNNGGISASTLNGANSSYIVGGQLYVADTLNNRMLIWDSIPTGNAEAADRVLGQLTFDNSSTLSAGVTAQTLNVPSGIHSDGTRLAVADNGNNRILVWNSLPTETGVTPDLVIGKTDFESSLSGITQNTMSDVTGGVVFTQNYLFAGGSNRVLRFPLPLSTGANADLVIGQSNFTTGSSNGGGLDAGSLSAVRGIHSDGTRLCIADSANNRVLFFNSLPTTDNPDADVILGQSNGGENTPNNGGVDADSLQGPTYCFIDGTRLIVSDFTNHRVLIWNSFPLANKASADVVVGQVNFGINTANFLGRTAATLDSPNTAIVVDGKLVIADGGNSRVLVFNSIPTANGASADLVFGHDDFTTGAFSSIPTPTNAFPAGLAPIGSRLFIPDGIFSRVLAIPFPS